MRNMFVNFFFPRLWRFLGEDKSRNLISDSIADSIFFPFTIHNLMMLPLAIVENAEHENHDGYNISFDRLCNPEK